MVLVPLLAVPGSAGPAPQPPALLVVPGGAGSTLQLPTLLAVPGGSGPAPRGPRHDW